MTTRLQKARLLGESMGVICGLMRSSGLSRTDAEAQLRKAMKRGFTDGKVKASREIPWISTMATLNGRWHLERGYVDTSGNPRPLSWNGRTGSLLRLAQNVAGKEKAREVVEDLVRRRLLVKTSDGKWLPRAQVLKPRGLDRPQALRTATMVQRLIRTIAHNSKRHYRGNDLLFEVMTRVPRLPARQLRAFKKFTQTQGMLYARSVDEWLEARNLRRSGPTSKSARDAGVIVFAFEEPTADP